MLVERRAEERESESDTAAVGQDEEALALVGRSHVSSSKADCRAAVAGLFEGGKDCGKSASCSPDVLPEDERGAALVGDAEPLEEETAACAGEPGSLPCNAEVLAGAAESEAIHDATPRAAVEAGNVVPDRSRCQFRLFHPGHEAGRCKGFPLDVHHSPRSAPGCKVDSEVEPTSAAEEGGDTQLGR